MRIGSPSTGERRGASAHRPGGVGFVSLLSGVEGQPDNFELTIVESEDEYFAPRHRHNFDQLRLMLRGGFGFDPGFEQNEGSIGYFCEGITYTQKGAKGNVHLLLQFGGASGSGYMSFRQLYAAVDELKTRGEFRDGLFFWRDSNGVERKIDGYQAAWEHVFKRKLEYPQPRFAHPIILYPERFDWVSEPGHDGVQHKMLATFNERGASLSMWKLRAGASMLLGCARRQQLHYVMSGTLRCDAAAIRAGDAIATEPGEVLRCEARTEAQFYRIELPSFATEVTAP
jgi:hypothetical protein